jgi:hypothetical protein
MTSDCDVDQLGNEYHGWFSTEAFFSISQDVNLGQKIGVAPLTWPLSTSSAGLLQRATMALHQALK